MIRTLDTILDRIIIRETRIHQMERVGIDPLIVDMEREVLDSLKTEYKSRINRLHTYIGIE